MFDTTASSYTIPTGYSGYWNFNVNLNEIQCWVGGVNILPPNSNDLISYFAIWDTDKSFPSGDTGSREGTGQVFKLYNNAIEEGFGAHSNQGSSAVIITNIPLTAVADIQALVLYNRQNATEAQEQRIVNMFFELYNSTYDPTYTTPLATTTPITIAQQAFKVFRFDFASITTYTGSFAPDNSITEIPSDTFAETEDGTFPAISTFEITGDVVVAGDLTAENIFVGSSNLITKINTKQDTIQDGDLQISNTLNLQTTLTNLDTNITENTSEITTLNKNNLIYNSKTYIDKAVTSWNSRTIPTGN